MDRRSLLAALGTAGVAGCLAPGANDARLAADDVTPPSDSPAETDATPTPTPEPTPESTDLELGRSFEEGGLEVTPVETRLARWIETGDGRIEDAPAGQVYLLVDVRVRNRSDDAREPPAPRAFVALVDGRQTEQLAWVRDAGRVAVPVAGDAYGDEGQIDPGSEVGGWLAFAIPDGADAVRLVWTGAATTFPNWRFGTDPSGLADISVSIDAPETVPVGREYTITLALTNDGASEGSFETTYRFDQPTMPAAEQTVERTLPAGETTEVTVEGTAAAVGTARFELSRPTRSRAIDLRTATTSLGSEWQYLDVATTRLTVQGAGDRIIHSSANDSGYFSAEDDRQFVLVEFAIRNRTDERLSPLQGKNFAAIVDGESIPPVGLALLGSAVEIDYPVEGVPYFSDSVLPPGQRRSGLLGFEVPDSIDLDALVVEARWERPGDNEAVVRWE